MGGLYSGERNPSPTPPRIPFPVSAMDRLRQERTFTDREVPSCLFLFLFLDSRGVLHSVTYLNKIASNRKTNFTFNVSQGHLRRGPKGTTIVEYTEYNMLISLITQNKAPFNPSVTLHSFRRSRVTQGGKFKQIPQKTTQSCK